MHGAVIIEEPDAELIATVNLVDDVAGSAELDLVAIQLKARRPLVIQYGLVQKHQRLQDS